MTFSDFGWPFHASRAVSAVAELLVVVVGGNPIGTRWSNFPAFLIVPFPNLSFLCFFPPRLFPFPSPADAKGSQDRCELSPNPGGDFSQG